MNGQHASSSISNIRLKESLSSARASKNIQYSEKTLLEAKTIWAMSKDQDRDPKLQEERKVPPWCGKKLRRSAKKR
ncbi:hypothetical protein [Dubosiella newyorkensis]|uniref:hypothetical protein n=1 Tax=Dubosiella newyorkensis TaxID=1862672 RepID=UPI003F6661A5